MENQNVLLIKEKLAHFIERIRQSKDVESVEEDFFQPNIYDEYKELHLEAQNLTTAQIKKNFSDLENKAIDFLNLGLQNKKEFETFIETLKTSNEDNSEDYNLSEHSSKWAGARAMAEFIKTPHGYALVHGGKKFNQYEDAELAVIFGSLFGVKLAADCVKSLKAEMVGSVIGYSLSGNYLKDIQAYSKLSAKEQEKTKLGEYLAACIKRQDVEGKFTYQEKNGLTILSGTIDENQGAPQNRTRAGGIVDHTFVNHTTKTITIGMSTSHESVEAQRDTFFKSLKAFEALAQQETVHGSPNPYYGYSIQPFYFLGGILLASDEQLELFQEKEIGGKFLSNLGPLQFGDKEQLAKLQYYRLFGNSPTPEVANSIVRFNTLIGGVDTQDIYERNTQLCALYANDPEGLNLVLFEQTISYFTTITNIVARSGMDMSLEGKTMLKTYLNNIIEMSENMFLPFPHQATAEEFESVIAPFYGALQNLIKVGTQNLSQENAPLLAKLKRHAKDYASLDNFNATMEDNASLQIKFEGVWEDPKKVAPKNAEIDYQKLKDKKLSTLVSQLSYGLTGQLSSNTQKFLARYQQLLGNVIDSPKQDKNGSVVKAAKNIAYGVGEHHKHTPLFNKAVAELRATPGGEAVAELLEKTNFLFASTRLKGDKLYLSYEANCAELQSLLENNPQSYTVDPTFCVFPKLTKQSSKKGTKR